jgi:hypothetical protein
MKKYVGIRENGVAKFKSRNPVRAGSCSTRDSNCATIAPRDSSGATLAAARAKLALALTADALEDDADALELYMGYKFSVIADCRRKELDAQAD